MTFQVSVTVKVAKKSGDFTELSTHTVSVPVEAETPEAAAQKFVHGIVATQPAPKGGSKP
jgi:hypothetical protein